MLGYTFTDKSQSLEFFDEIFGKENGKLRNLVCHIFP